MTRTSATPFAPPADGGTVSPEPRPVFGRWFKPETMRLLPLVMVAAVAVLGVRVSNVAADVGGLIDGDGTILARLAGLEPAAEGDDATENNASGGNSADGADTQPAFMSRSEVDLLQDLAHRRQELNDRSDQIDTRERLLMATEQRIDRKIERLKTLESDIKELLRIHSEEEEAQLKTLVRVYEAMKPRDAARILERLEMEILVSVVQRMGDRRVAPVLAEMDPEVARAVTAKLATAKVMPTIDTES
ncbi:MAG: hypothetical protein WEB93_02765 [Sphingomonadales bacterium]